MSKGPKTPYSQYLPPEPELTPADLLAVELIRIGERFPGGYHVAADLRLDKAIAEVEELFTERQLPNRPELVAELTLWRHHVNQELDYAQRCERLLSTVIRRVKDGDVPP